MNNNNNEPLLRLEKVSKYYSTAGNLALGLHNVSLSLKRGEIVAVTGQSGSGKSTFLNVITGVDTYEDGEIYFNGQTTSYFSKKDMEDYRKHNVGFIYQNYNLVESYTVLENVILPFILKGENNLEAKAHALEIIDRVGLTSRISHRATKLSGGEKQRTVIARAIASDSPILACDEPTGNLDSKTGKEIINLINEVSKDRLVLIVTHDYNSVKDIATRRIRFSDGDLVEDVKVRENNPVTREFSHEGKQKLTFKEGYKLAFKNLIRTPKKTILSLLIFIICAFVVFGNYSALTTNYKKSYDFTNTLNNSTPGRALIYNEKKEELDYKEIEKKVTTKTYLNSFVLDMRSVGNNYYLTPYLPYGLDLTGRLPKDETECVVINSQLGSLFGDSMVTYNVGDELKYYDTYLDTTNYKKLKVVGTYSGVTKGTAVYAPLLYDSYKDKIVLEQTKSRFFKDDNSTSSIVYDNNLSIGKFNVFYDNTVFSVSDLKKVDLEVKLAGYYLSINSEDIIYTPYDLDDTTTNNLKLSASEDTIKDLFNTHVFQIDTLPSGRYSLGDLKRDLKSFDVVVKTPSDYNNVGVSELIDTISNFFLIINLIILLLIVYFISYFILSKIYKTKNKDYTMIRSLGAGKKDMARVVRFETLMLSSFGSIIVIIVGFILANVTTYSLFSTFNDLDPYAYVLYVILMGLFGILMAGRFNSKLFKYSVNENLKKGEVEND